MGGKLRYKDDEGIGDAVFVYKPNEVYGSGKAFGRDIVASKFKGGYSLVWEHEGNISFWRQFSPQVCRAGWGSAL